MTDPSVSITERPVPPGGMSWSRLMVAAMALMGVIAATMLLAGRARGGGVVPDQLPWLHDVGVANQTAAAQRRPVMLFFTADWCGPCQRFKRDVLHQAQVREAIEATVVPVKVDLTNPDMPTRGLAQRYEVEGIPDLLLTDAQGRVLSRLDRSLDADAFIRWIRQVASAVDGS